MQWRIYGVARLVLRTRNRICAVNVWYTYFCVHVKILHVLTTTVNACMVLWKLLPGYSVQLLSYSCLDPMKQGLIKQLQVSVEAI